MPAPSIANIAAQFSYADAKETGRFTLEMFASGQKPLTAPPTFIDPETGIPSIKVKHLGPKIEADDIDFTDAFATFADETKDRYPGAKLVLGQGVYPIRNIVLPPRLALVGGGIMQSMFWVRDGVTSTPILSEQIDPLPSTNDPLREGLYLRDFSTITNHWGNSGQTWTTMKIVSPDQKSSGVSGFVDPRHTIIDVDVYAPLALGMHFRFGESTILRPSVRFGLGEGIFLDQVQDTKCQDALVAATAGIGFRAEKCNDLTGDGRFYFTGSNFLGTTPTGSDESDRKARWNTGAAAIFENVTDSKFHVIANDTNGHGVVQKRCEGSDITAECMNSASLCIGWPGVVANDPYPPEIYTDPGEAPAGIWLEASNRIGISSHLKCTTAISRKRPGQAMRAAVGIEGTKQKSFAALKRIRIDVQTGHAYNNPDNLDMREPWVLHTRPTAFEHLSGDNVKISFGDDTMGAVQPGGIATLEIPAVPLLNGDFTIIERGDGWNITVAIPGATSAIDGAHAGIVRAQIVNHYAGALYLEESGAPFTFEDVWIGENGVLSPLLAVQHVGDMMGGVINIHASEYHFSTSPQASYTLTDVAAKTGASDDGRAVYSLNTQITSPTDIRIGLVVSGLADTAINGTFEVTSKEGTTDYVVEQPALITGAHDASGLSGAVMAPGPSSWRLPAGKIGDVITLINENIDPSNPVTITFDVSPARQPTSATLTSADTSISVKMTPTGWVILQSKSQEVAMIGFTLGLGRIFPRPDTSPPATGIGAMTIGTTFTVGAE